MSKKIIVKLSNIFSTDLDEVRHEVLVLLEEGLEGEEDLLELGALGPLQLVQDLVGLAPRLLLLLGELLHGLLERGRLLRHRGHHLQVLR